MNDKYLDKLISASFEDEISIPENLSERLENEINKYIKRRNSEIRGRIHLKYTCIAASILVCTGLFFMKPFNTSDKSIKDTFKDPVEAEIYVRQTLALVSENLNKGLSSFDKAKNNIDNTNRILNNILIIK
jgi:hypothetical protein